MSGEADSRKRRDRLARALRENLRRRKTQSRGRSDPAPVQRGPGREETGPGEAPSVTGRGGTGPAGAEPSDDEPGAAAGEAPRD